MNIYEFMSVHPVLTFFLAMIAGDTIANIFYHIFSKKK